MAVEEKEDMLTIRWLTSWLCLKHECDLYKCHQFLPPFCQCQWKKILRVGSRTPGLVIIMTHDGNTFKSLVILQGCCLAWGFMKRQSSEDNAMVGAKVMSHARTEVPTAPVAAQCSGFLLHFHSEIF